MISTRKRLVLDNVLAVMSVGFDIPSAVALFKNFWKSSHNCSLTQNEMYVAEATQALDSGNPGAALIHLKKVDLNTVSVQLQRIATTLEIRAREETPDYDAIVTISGYISSGDYETAFSLITMRPW